MSSAPVLVVEYGVEQARLLDAASAARISAAPGDRFRWSYLPEYAPGAADRTQPLLDNDGVRALQIWYPTALSSGVYTLQQVPSSAWDDRDLSDRQRLFTQRLRVRHPFQSHLVDASHPNAPTVVVQESGVTHWVHWTARPPTDSDWRRLYAQLQVETQRLLRLLGERGLDAATSELGVDLSMRLMGMRRPGADAQWYYAYEEKSYPLQLSVFGPPSHNACNYRTAPQRASSFAELFGPDHLALDALQRRAVLAWLDPSLVRELPAHGGTHRALDTPGLWLAERRRHTDDDTVSVELLAMHELIELPRLHATPAQSLQSMRQRLEAVTLRGTEDSLVVGVLHLELDANDDDDTTTVVDDTLTLSTVQSARHRCRWYVYPVWLDETTALDERLDTTRLLAALCESHNAGQLVGEGDTLSLHVHELMRTTFLHDRERDLLAGQRVVLAFVCYDELDQLSSSSTAPLTSLSADASGYVLPARTAPVRVLSVQEALARERIAPLVDTRLPTADDAPKTAATLPGLSWRAPLGALVLVLQRPRAATVAPPEPPLPQPQLQLAPYVLQQMRHKCESLIRDAARRVERAPAESPRLETFTLASVVERVARSRLNVRRALDALAKHHMRSVSSLLDDLERASPLELFENYGFAAVLGSSDLMWTQPTRRVGPEPSSRTLLMAPWRLERVAIWAADGFSDAGMRWLRYVARLDTAQPLYGSADDSPPSEAQLLGALQSLDEPQFAWLCDLKQRDVIELERQRRERTLDGWAKKHFSDGALRDTPLYTLLSRAEDVADQTVQYVRAQVQVYARVQARVDAAHASRRRSSGDGGGASPQRVLDGFRLSDFTPVLLHRAAALARVDNDPDGVQALLHFDRLPVRLFPAHWIERDLCAPLPLGAHRADELCVHYAQNWPFDATGQYYRHDSPPADPFAGIPAGKPGSTRELLRLAWLAYRARRDGSPEKAQLEQAIREHAAALNVRVVMGVIENEDGTERALLRLRDEDPLPATFADALQSVYLGYQPASAVQNPVWRARIQSLQDAYLRCAEPGRLERIYELLEVDRRTLATVYTRDDDASARLYEQWSRVQQHRLQRWFVNAQVMVQQPDYVNDASRLVEPPSMALFYAHLDAAPVSVQLAASLRAFQPRALALDRRHRTLLWELCSPTSAGGRRRDYSERIARDYDTALRLGLEQLRVARDSLRADNQNPRWRKLLELSDAIRRQHDRLRSVVQQYARHYADLLQAMFALDTQHLDDVERLVVQLEAARNDVEAQLRNSVPELTKLDAVVRVLLNEEVQQRASGSSGDVKIGGQLADAPDAARIAATVQDARAAAIRVLQPGANDNWSEMALVEALGRHCDAPAAQWAALAALVQWMVEFPRGRMQLQEIATPEEQDAADAPGEPHRLAAALLQSLSVPDVDVAKREFARAYDEMTTPFRQATTDPRATPRITLVVLLARSYAVEPAQQVADRLAHAQIALYEAGRALDSRAARARLQQLLVLLQATPDWSASIQREARTRARTFLSDEYKAQQQRQPLDPVQQDGAAQLTWWLLLLRGAQPLQNIARRFWREQLHQRLSGYRDIMRRVVQLFADPLRLDDLQPLFSTEMSHLQTRFFRPESREAGLLAAAFNTCFAADPDDRRDATALPRVVWARRVRELEQRVEAEREQASTTVARPLWAADELLALLLRRKSASDLAHAALRAGVAEFQQVGPSTRGVVPARQLELLLWTLLESPAFLTMRQRYSLDALGSDDAPLFQHWRVAWRITEMDRFHTVDEANARALLEEVQWQLPGALTSLAKLGDTPRYARNVVDMWRLALFGYAHQPSVVLLPLEEAQPLREARPAPPDTTVPLSVLQAAQLARFVVDLDQQLQRGIAALADKADREALQAADAMALLHSCFVWLLAYVAPARQPYEALFAQQLHPDGRVLHDYVHGVAVIELARRVYNVALHRRPVNLQWRSEWRRLIGTGLLYDPDERVHTIPLGAQGLVAETAADERQRFYTDVVSEALRREPMRLLARYERSARPFDPDEDLAHGRALCYMRVDRDGSWRDASPLAAISTAPTPALPEGVDCAYSAQFADFELDERYSVFQWQVGQQLYLRPERARANRWSEDTPDLGPDNAALLEVLLAAQLDVELFLPSTPLLRWFERVRARGFDHRPNAAQAKDAADRVREGKYTPLGDDERDAQMQTDLRPDGSVAAPSDADPRAQQKQQQYDALADRLSQLRELSNQAPWNSQLFADSAQQLRADAQVLTDDVARAAGDAATEHTESSYVALAQRVKLLEEGAQAHADYLLQVQALLRQQLDEL